MRTDWQSWIADLSAPHTSADAVALGGALGTLIGIFPTPGFSILLALLVLAAFPTMNKPALVIALAFWNPMVCVPLYHLAHGIGHILPAFVASSKTQFVILDQSYSFSHRFLAGIGIIAVICSLLVYAGLWSITTWRQHRT